MSGTVTTRARQLRLVTVTKKNRDGDAVSRSGAAIRKPVLRRAGDLKSTYGGRRVELLTLPQFSKTSQHTATAPDTLKLQARILFLRRGGAAIANLPPALAVRVTVSGPRKFTSLQSI
ncbi:hypothetical protein Zmor_024858 [Zophobas morio]|uniref:Uncharacterized protein n=1 Tax=Zophobas morio TaxID=2755281 RepID=A0AA38M326_9CUCU|nr:hypothetical protein Zmor_024858 [Zophobas morio]